MGSMMRRGLLTLALAVAGAGAAYLLFNPQRTGREGGSDGRAEQKAPVADSAPTSSVDAATATDHGRSVTVKAPSYRAVFSSNHAALTEFFLKGERFRNEEGRPLNLVSTDKPKYLPLQLSLEGREEMTGWKVQQSASKEAVFVWEGDGLRVVRKVEVGEGPYQLWSTWRVHNVGEQPVTVRPHLATFHYVPREKEESGFFSVRAPGVSHGVCRYAEETTRKDREDLLVKHGYGSGDVRFVAVENVHFATALAAHDQEAQRCQLNTSDRGGTVDEPHGSLFEARLIYPRVKLARGEAQSYKALAFVGPKEPEALQAAGHELPEVVDLGFFSVIAKGLVDLLRVIYRFVGNWGLAIILLTVLVKLVLYPLTEKSFRSMARMRHLKPEMDRINELYKDDREKKGAAMMELYRKQKINPLGGCLPQLLQLPIWWALYTSLSTNVELYHAEFVWWWDDLSSPDPYFVLPVSLGLLMFVQQKITPSAMDPAQAKMMLYMMPIMITSFMLFLPAGLCLYMVTNSALGLAQQQFIHHRLDKQSSPAGGAAAAGAEEQAPDSPGDKPGESSSTQRRANRSGRSKVRQRRQRRGRA